MQIDEARACEPRREVVAARADALEEPAPALAVIRGRTYVMPEDVHSLFHDVLRHRVLTTYEAEAEEVTSDDVVAKVLGKIESP